MIKYHFFVNNLVPQSNAALLCIAQLKREMSEYFSNDEHLKTCHIHGLIDVNEERAMGSFLIVKTMSTFCTFCDTVCMVTRTTCSACLEEMDVGTESVRFNCLAHFCHPFCASKWLIRSGTCPMCRMQQM